MRFLEVVEGFIVSREMNFLFGFLGLVFFGIFLFFRSSLEEFRNYEFFMKGMCVVRGGRVVVVYIYVCDFFGLYVVVFFFF